MRSDQVCKLKSLIEVLRWADIGEHVKVLGMLHGHQ